MSEVMKWLIDSKYEFDYLINLDSDCLFAKQGFEQFIEKEMNNSDYMGLGSSTYRQLDSLSKFPKGMGPMEVGI